MISRGEVHGGDKKIMKTGFAFYVLVALAAFFLGIIKKDYITFIFCQSSRNDPRSGK